MAALESLVPTDLEVHLQMNSSRFETYDAMRAEVLAFIESRTGSRMTETKVHKHDKIRDDPMDLDSVVKGKGKNKFSGSCYICGKVGHKSTECWSRDRASNKGSGRNQSANVTSSGKRQVSRARYRRSERTSQRSRQEQKQGQRQMEIQRQERDFRAADPPIHWSLRRSLGKRPMTRWSSPWGIHGGRYGVGGELVQNCIWRDLAR